MDPLSIVSGCAGLIATIGSLSLSINTFVRTCREARADLDRVRRELVSLQTVLELIQEDASDEAKTFPQTLEHHVSGIVTNCNSVVLEIQECITKYGGDNRLKTKAGWTINGQGDVTKLRSNLEAHKAALELALDMLALHVTREIKTDTTEIRNDTAAIKDDTAQILEEIARLQERLPKQAGNDYILQHFLEEMTTYTEKALDGESIGTGCSSPRAAPSVLEEEEQLEPPPEHTYREEWEKSSVESETAWREKQEKEWEPQLAEPGSSAKSVREPSSSHQDNTRPTASGVHLSEHQESPEGWKEDSLTIHSNQDANQLRLRSTPATVDTGSNNFHNTDQSDVQQARQEIETEGISSMSAEHGVASQALNAENRDNSKEPALEASPINSLYARTGQGRLVINLPIPKSILDRLPEESGPESSLNTFTAVMTNPSELALSALRPFLLKRSIKIVFFIKVDHKLDEGDFETKWTYITYAIEGLSRWDKERKAGLSPGEYIPPPPWQQIIVLIEGPPQWKNTNKKLHRMLTDLGILHMTNDSVLTVNGAPLNQPYHTDDDEFLGRRVRATIREYTVPPSIRLRADFTRIAPVQVIAVARHETYSEYMTSLSTPTLVQGWSRRICEILEPQFIITLPLTALWAFNAQIARDFLQRVWLCQLPFKGSRSKSSNKLVFTSPEEFAEEHDKLLKRSERAQRSVWGAFRSSR